MSPAPTNPLAHARSAYLRSAMHQPVQWNEWGPAAFQKALQQDKPILLDIGAVWCHWCHVMDRESYDDPALAEIINDLFIPIKVDRDERPDVDTRYQAAVSAISGQGGWPLTAFLTPAGKPFFGGTYFPPDDRHGRPGMRRVLLTMAESFRDKRADVDESSDSVMAAIEHAESFQAGPDAHQPNPGPALLNALLTSTLQQFDPRFGGFGTEPKFPNPAALDLLLDAASRDTPHQHAAQHAAAFTLDRMARGGVYDHLAGGFHRYSTDERWVVPHFEKMSYDNSELLRAYVHAFQTLVDPALARTAHDILLWIDASLSDREHGGFYASQDADLSLDDDGDYFTWTLDEAKAVLTDRELAIAGLFYDIGELGDMHHNPKKNVLHIDHPLEKIAASAKIHLEEASSLLDTARAKLLAARALRPTPYIDKTLYVGWNAMMISAYLEAARVLNLPEAKTFALKSLDRLLTSAWDGTDLGHVIAYGETPDTTEPSIRIEVIETISLTAPETIPSAIPPLPVPGVLDDYVFTANACLDAWEATADHRYFAHALTLADTAIQKFYDPSASAFFDTEPPAPGTLPLGALTARRKPLQDSPTPAGNPVAVTLLVRLEALTGREDLAAKAQATLESFAGVVEHLGLYAASYGLALQRLILPPVQVVIVGSDALARTMERASMARYAVNKTVVRFDSISGTTLPPTLTQTLPNLPKVEGSYAVLCSGYTCQPPFLTVESLTEALLAAL